MPTTVNVVEGDSVRPLSHAGQKRQGVFLACVTMFAAASAANAADDKRDYDRRVEKARAALISAADPDSLTAAALLSITPKERSANSLKLIARAAAGAPDRADITWLHAQLCARRKSCNPDPVVSHLRDLDPKNGVAWIDTLGRGSASNDPAGNLARLDAVAHADRFDVYLNSLVAHTTSAILKTGAMDTQHALASMLGFVQVEAIPVYAPLTSLCKGDALNDAQVLDDCRRFSAVLRRGDTYISEMVGTAIAKKVWAERDPEYQDALSARRTAHYRMAMAFKVDIDQWTEEFASRYLQLIETRRTEQEVGLALLSDAGIPPDPPADWKDTLPE